MSTYSMAQVESLTGISAHKLRVWERRYNFLNPERTKTNIRFYSDDEVIKLLNVAILVRNGFRISKIGAMAELEMHEHVTDLMSNVNEEVEDEINLLTLAMLEMNEEEFSKVFQRRINRKGLLGTITDLIYPFLDHIGVLWGTKKLMPAQEHFASNLIRQKIIAAIDALPIPGEDARSICMFLLEEEDHEIGLLLASYIARDLGWKVYYLGQKVPLDNISQVLQKTKPELVLSLFIMPSTERTVKLINQVVNMTETPFLVIGKEDNFLKVERMDRLHHIKSPADLIRFLNGV